MIFGGKFGSGTKFSPSSSVFIYQGHSNQCPVFIFIYLPSASCVFNN